MTMLLKNNNWSLTLSLNLLNMLGFLGPREYSGIQGAFLKAYCVFWYIFLNGIYIIVQAGDLFQIWGNLPLMVSTSFLLFTNLALGMKMINVIYRRKEVQAIIDEGDAELMAENREEGAEIIKSCNRETSHLLYLYILLSGVTVLGWGASAEENDLPLRAWYPYDTTKSPAYEITYFHQVTALFIAAFTNISLDTLVTSLIAVCRCRLRLLDLSLRNLCTGLYKTVDESNHHQDTILLARLSTCVLRHQAALKTTGEIQRCFSEPILAQFTVSMVIICVTAYQIAVELYSTSKHVVRIVAMTSYLLCMVLQVFLYCYQGNQLSVESSELASAAYDCPWYVCSIRFRRALLVIMIRSKRNVQLVAGGLTTLSLACFTAIVKASYTFFTVLQRVEDKRK